MKKLFLIIIVLFISQTLLSQKIDNDVMMKIEKATSMLMNDKKSAASAFNEILKGKNKKNVAVIVEIGRAYLNADDIESAKEYAQMAKDADNKDASAYLFSGDVYIAQDDVNNASSEYNQAIYFDENCVEAYLKYADVYKAVNPQLSVDMLEKLKKKFPNDIRINKLMADIFYSMGKYGQAMELYNVYMQKTSPDERDFTRYATLLYLNKDYQKSLDAIIKGLAINPNSHLLKRLLMYNKQELKRPEEALKVAKVFFANNNEKDYVYLDYLYYGRILADLNMFDEAVKQYHKAFEVDKSHVEIYKELSALYEKMNDYDNAIDYYNKFIDSSKNMDNANELFLYGRLIYYAAADSVNKSKQPAYLEKADKIFEKVAEKIPESYIGNFWRARVNSLKDPDTTYGLAKPYYEAALDILQKNVPTSKSQIIECNSYLGYYYYIKGDNNQSKVYWHKILELDPQNKTAIKALEEIK